jgi:hypothetical protein
MYLAEPVATKGFLQSLPLQYTCPYRDCRVPSHMHHLLHHKTSEKDSFCKRPAAAKETSRTSSWPFTWTTDKQKTNISKNREQVSMPRGVVESMLLYSVGAFWKVEPECRNEILALVPCQGFRSQKRRQPCNEHEQEHHPRRNLLFELRPSFMQVGNSPNY